MNDKELNAGLGRSGLSRQGRAQTPDDVDRNDQYIPVGLSAISQIASVALTMLVACGFAGLLVLLWWVGQP